MITTQTRKPLLTPAPRSRFPNLFCRDSSTGQLLWSRSLGLPAYKLSNANVRLTSSCGRFEQQFGGASEVLLFTELTFLHAHGNRIVSVLNTNGDNSWQLGNAAALASWDLDGNLQFVTRQRDLPESTRVFGAAARDQFVWILTSNNANATYLQAYDVVDGLLSSTRNAGFLQSENIGPMVRPDGSVFAGSGSTLGVLNPDGSWQWTRDDLLAFNQAEYYMYPNGDLLIWERITSDVPGESNLIRISGSSGATLATSSQQPGETYWYRGDGYGGPLQGSGGGFVFLPDGRIAFSGLYTGHVWGQVNLLPGGSFGDYVLFPEPIYPTAGSLPIGWDWFWFIISGILDQDLRIVDYRQDRSVIGEGDDEIFASHQSQGFGNLFWNDAAIPLLGEWLSEIDVPGGVTEPWPIGLSGSADIEPRRKGESITTAVRDTEGNWYSPQLGAGQTYLKSVDTLGNERWKIDLKRESDLQLAANFVAISEDGTKVFYLSREVESL
ncbi:hypothetical protein [Rubinisphaera sp.]|uniref:hypothetical protein n=1 Tax=Rubinisphaera sp. TaxID=2024857 RepID=UPI000C0C9BCA|nr:hypothetical protein [Rubinisphaera sp.]MBV07811.1 hypothetical protein [Rubinisphaera sp.]HCS53173.1 hypothetical protein [Planctomycetaceae bacterium]|tara:strand:- start:833 stop:2320 length:1488 start_codon:yes stop_codon:yes gene_type:complete